jgi:hypothetical protein
MADIAAVFHWSPDALGAMSPADLAVWREKALARAGRAPGGRGGQGARR